MNRVTFALTAVVANVESDRSASRIDIDAMEVLIHAEHGEHLFIERFGILAAPVGNLDRTRAQRVARNCWFGPARARERDPDGQQAASHDEDTSRH